MKKLSLFVRNIKKGFATNSSSYHSMVMMNEEEYEKWKNGEIEINGYSYEEWNDDEYAETDEDSYTAANGERILVFCKYGSDY